MYSHNELASLLPALLRAVADEMERDNTLAERILGNLPDALDKKRVKRAPIGFDPFELLRHGNVGLLRERLESLDLPSLKTIVTEHGLDTTRLAQKWRDKQRLVNFILERITARAGKGDVFKEVG